MGGGGEPHKHGDRQARFCCRPQLVYLGQRHHVALVGEGATGLIKFLFWIWFALIVATGIVGGPIAAPGVFFGVIGLIPAHVFALLAAIASRCGR